MFEKERVYARCIAMNTRTKHFLMVLSCVPYWAYVCPWTVRRKNKKEYRRYWCR